MPATDISTPFTVPIRGEDIPVEVSTNISKDAATASFKAQVNGKHISSETLEGLRGKLLNETKRAAVKVSIPFSMVGKAHDRYGMPRGPMTVLHGVITGIHQGTYKPLVRWDANGKSEQLDRAGTVFKPLDKETADRLLALRAQNVEIERQISELESANRLDPRKAVEEAIDAETKTVATR